MPDPLKFFKKSFGESPSAAARAPGRVEFIGNHTDYNLGTVLGAAIDRGLAVAVRRAAKGTFRFASSGASGLVEVTGANPGRMTGESGWANFPLGVWHSLHEFGLPRPEGFELAVVSDLPAGAGLSSSAALELATALALLRLEGAIVPRKTVVELSRHAENTFVGVPCGILDQGVSGFGRRDHLVHIDCRGPHFDVQRFSSGARLWIFNTHSKHALVDSLYARRHAECMEAARLLGERIPGVKALADLSPEQVEDHASVLPPVVLARARHVTGDIRRVAAVREALDANRLTEVGRLLVGSHESSRDNFENSTPELDFLVDALTGTSGVYGARLTGGGFGGAALALADAKFNLDAATVIAGAYRAKFSSELEILACQTEDGASELEVPGRM